MKEACVECGAALKTGVSMYKGVKLVCLQCPMCKEKIFTEELSLKAIQKMESARLQPSYRRPILRIGSSVGFTIPKDIAQALELEGKIVSLRPNIIKKKIDVTVV